jgi:hypothetical protein
VRRVFKINEPADQSCGQINAGEFEPEMAEFVERFMTAERWDLEGPELPAILKHCGASIATLKKFKSIGWLE